MTGDRLAEDWTAGERKADGRVYRTRRQRRDPRCSKQLTEKK
jgi:hypothetical protein